MLQKLMSVGEEQFPRAPGCGALVLVTFIPTDISADFTGHQDHAVSGSSGCGSNLVVEQVGQAGDADGRLHQQFPAGGGGV